MNPKTIKEIAAVIGAEIKGDYKGIATGVAVDSRLVRPGDLFFALPGCRMDGHSFIGDAISAGAVGAVVRKGYHGQNFGAPLLYVDNTLVSLQTLSKEVLKNQKATVIAVTGSLGKTTTKGFIASLLKHKYKVSASPGNSNSQIGLPLSILNHTSDDDEIIILEMAMTQQGQIAKLVEIAPPHIAVVTSVALVHAENFSGLEDIARSKAEIFTHPSTRLGIYNKESDLDQILSRTGKCRKQSFSITSDQADFYLNATGKSLEVHEAEGAHAQLPSLTIPGKHNLHNFAAAATVARYLGMDWKEIASAQNDLELPERRFQTLEKFGAIFVNDAYNASEMSMKAAFDSLPSPRNGGKKIAVLGGMVELGKFSEKCHQAVGKYALDKVDTMLCFGDDCLPMVKEWEAAGRPVIWKEKLESLTSELRKLLQPGDVVLLKGSQSKGVWKVLDLMEDR